MNTLPAVHYEEGDYNKCIEVCQKAVDIGREHRADFKLIAKYVTWFSFINIFDLKKHSHTINLQNIHTRALARQGNAYVKLDDLPQALVVFNKSLTEHRQSDIIKKAQEVCVCHSQIHNTTKHMNIKTPVSFQLTHHTSNTTISTYPPSPW